MFDEVQNESLFQQVSEEELLGVMKSFQKDKIPGPDGWTIEFFIHFFDLIKSDLLQMIEESRISSNIHHLISSTLIALIPKKHDATSSRNLGLYLYAISLLKLSQKLLLG